MAVKILTVNARLTQDAGERKTRRQRQNTRRLVSAGLLLALAWSLSGASFSPSALEYGNLAVGIGTELKSVTLVNRSSRDLQLVSRVEGESASDFRIDPTRCARLSAGATCILPVTFQPLEPGNRRASLKVLGLEQEDVNVELSGTAMPAAVVVSPGELEFASMPLGSPPEVREVTLKGEGWFHVHGSFVQGSQKDLFTVRADPCLENTSELKECTIQVMFQPAQEGEALAELVIQDDGLQAPHYVKLRAIVTPPLTPTPTPASTPTPTPPTPTPTPTPVTRPLLRIEPESAILNFDSSSDKPQQVHVWNVGQAPLHLQTRLQGNDPDRFEVQTSGCVVNPNVSAGQDCLITVRYKPKLLKGKTSYDAALEVEHNAPNVATPQAISLRWIRKPPEVQISVEPSILDFSGQLGQEFAAKSFTVSNKGNISIRQVSLSLGFWGGGEKGPFHVNSKCGQLQPREQCSVEVTFAPKEAKTYTEKLYMSGVPLQDLVTVDLKAVVKPADVIGKAKLQPSLAEAALLVMLPTR
jgi:hypothetical protein